jgi:hypothetical protein
MTTLTTNNMNASTLIATTLNTVVPAWSNLNIDPSKSSFIELFALINKEYKEYKGMANYQAENGDIQKALKYQDIEFELHKVIRATSHLVDGKPKRRVKKV